jgi:Protein of unknown function (DUF2934)
MKKHGCKDADTRGLAMPGATRVCSPPDGNDRMSDLTFAEKIRERAYQLWQQDGSLEGCADEYWQMARALVEQELGLPYAPDSANPDAAAPGGTNYTKIGGSPDGVAAGPATAVIPSTAVPSVQQTVRGQRTNRPVP